MNSSQDIDLFFQYFDSSLLSKTFEHSFDTQLNVILHHSFVEWQMHLQKHSFDLSEAISLLLETVRPQV